MNDERKMRRDFAIQCVYRLWIGLDRRRHGLGRRWPRERPSSGDGFIGDESQRELIRSVIGVPSARLFGRHVADRAQHDARGRAGGLRHGLRQFGPAEPVQLGKPEVDDLHVIAVAHHDVLGLEIAMHDARSVRLRKTLGDLVGDVGEPSRRQPAVGQQIAQGLALHPFHGDERHAGLMANVMDGQDVRMVQGGSRLGFLLEAMQTISIVGDTGWEDFDRDSAIEAGIERAVYLTHAACTERTDDLIRTERGPCRKAHRTAFLAVEAGETVTSSGHWPVPGASGIGPWYSRGSLPAAMSFKGAGQIDCREAGADASRRLRTSSSPFVPRWLRSALSVPSVPGGQPH